MFNIYHCNFSTQEMVSVFKKMRKVFFFYGQYSFICLSINNLAIRITISSYLGFPHNCYRKGLRSISVYCSRVSMTLRRLEDIVFLETYSSFLKEL